MSPWGGWSLPAYIEVTLLWDSFARRSVQVSLSKLQLPDSANEELANVPGQASGDSPDCREPPCVFRYGRDKAAVFFSQYAPTMSATVRTRLLTVIILPRHCVAGT
jgi:hypothetical protein